jgi:hypothetical protein
VVVHDCNPSTWESEVELLVSGQPALYSKTLKKNIKSPGTVAHTCNLNYSGGVEVGRIAIPASLGKS